MTEKSPMEQHLQSAMYGTPKLKPDEQRHYLGTFRERVSLTMTIAEVMNRDNLSAYLTEITAHPDEEVLLNGHIDQADLGPYLKLASQHNVKFTIKEENIYGVNDSDLGLVVAASQAINISPVALAQKYPHQVPAPTESTDKPKKSGWFNRLFREN